jgi:hypothetical protein
MKASMLWAQLLTISLVMYISGDATTAATTPFGIGPSARSRISEGTSLLQSTIGSCATSRPNGKVFAPETAGWNHGNHALVTWLPPDGIVVFKPGGPGFVLEDGALSMKFGWWRLRRGQLAILGQRLDGPAPAMRASIPNGYGDIGFQATALIFPTPGCWAVTARLGDTNLNFVVLVEKIGPGPGRAASR